MNLVLSACSQRLRATLGAAVFLALTSQSAGAAQSLRALSSQPPTQMQLPFLMTDGSILAQSGEGQTWYRYVPDIHGSYASGTWSQVASLQNGYDPSAFASAVLADGR